MPNANHVMELNSITDAQELLGDDLGDGEFKWHGGASESTGIWDDHLLRPFQRQSCS